MEYLIWPEWFIRPIEKQTGYCDRLWSKWECKRDAGRTDGERKGRGKNCTQMVDLKS